MKMKFVAMAQGAFVLVSVTGCVQSEEDLYSPRRQPGFRPPSAPVVQDLTPVDPTVPPVTLNPLPDHVPPMPPQEQPITIPPNAPQIGGQPSVPTPPSVPQQPVVQPESRPVEQPKTQKPAVPQYAKRVPGKPNLIINPYTGATLDATGLTPGTEVRDPRTGQTMLVP